MHFHHVGCLRLLFFILAWPTSWAVRKSVEHSGEEMVDPSESSLRTELQILVLDKTLRFKRFKLLLNRHNETSLFEQTRHYFEDLGGGFGGRWGSMFFEVAFVGEGGYDDGGLSKEWLQGVLESIVISKEDKEEDRGLDCLTKKHDCVNGPQYLLEQTPSGQLIPIMSSQFIVPDVEPKEPEKVEASPLQKRYHFLGKWIARAYVVSDLGYAPYSFHPKIYEILLGEQDGTTTTPKNFYSEEDTIPACEELADIHQRRSPVEMEGYGWQKCNEVLDPESNRYTQESCYKPLYRDAAMWEYLYTEWGPLAHLASSPKQSDDMVSFTDAKEYTKLRCEAFLKQFVEPVKEMAAGFQEVLQPKNPSFSFFWDHVKGRPSNLKHLIEGNQEVDVDGLVRSAEWIGNWSESRKSIFIDVLHQLQAEGEHSLTKPLNRLLRFFTGSLTAPVGGWEAHDKPPILEVRDSDYNAPKMCKPLKGKTCVNQLVIPEACLNDRVLLHDIILESVANSDFGFV